MVSTRPRRASKEASSPTVSKKSKANAKVSSTGTRASLPFAVLSLVVSIIGAAFTLGLGGHDPSSWTHDVFESALGSMQESFLCQTMPAVCSAFDGLSSRNFVQQRPEVFGQIVQGPILDPENPVLNLEFYNRLPYEISVIWKDYEGEEQPWFLMEPYSYHGNISSVRGHVWVFRLTETDQVLFEEMIDVDHCGKIMIAPPEHLEALRQICHETGRAVLGHWPRAPVVREMAPLTPVGHVREFSSEHTHFHDEPSQEVVSSFKIRTLSTAPHLLEIDGFLSDEECDHLIEVASTGDRMNPSLTVDDGIIPPMLGSSTWLEHSETPIVSAITSRLFDLMGYEEDVETFYFAERIQVSRYGTGEQYAPHFDAMDMTTSQRDLPHNRYATLMMFLNDVEEEAGGQEVFPRADFADEFAKSACESDLQIQPKKGKLVILYSMQKSGEIDETSLHGSCPVISEGAEKWTSSVYLWDPFVQWSH